MSRNKVVNDEQDSNVRLEQTLAFQELEFVYKRYSLEPLQTHGRLQTALQPHARGLLPQQRLRHHLADPVPGASHRDLRRTHHRLHDLDLPDGNFAFRADLVGGAGRVPRSNVRGHLLRRTGQAALRKESDSREGSAAPVGGRQRRKPSPGALILPPILAHSKLISEKLSTVMATLGIKVRPPPKKQTLAALPFTEQELLPSR